MTIYKYEYDKYRNKINIEEVEVKETNKCYIGLIRGSRFLKDNIDILNTTYPLKMVSLSKNNKNLFIKYANEYLNNKIKAKQVALEKAIEDLKQFEILVAKEV